MVDPRTVLYHAWIGWARQAIGGAEAMVTGAATRALYVVETGGTSEQAAAAAIEWARQADRAAADAAEAGHVEWVIADLESMRPSTSFPAGARSHLLRRYRTRLARLTPQGPSLAPGVPGPAMAPAVPGATLAPAAAVPHRPPNPDAGVLVLSYVGAFLLVVAALLFDIYGFAGLDDTQKFLVVLGLDLFFGAAGYACYRSRRLRIVGPSYVALFALVFPLVILAAYEFLYLRQRGIEPNLAVFVGGIACAVLYGSIAPRLRSTAYAVMALVAVPVAALGLVDNLDLADWSGLALVLVGATYASLALAVPAASNPSIGIFRRPAQGLAHALAAVGVVTSAVISVVVGVVGVVVGGSSSSGLVDPYLPLTFGTVAAMYLILAAPGRQRWYYAVAAPAVSLAVLTGGRTFHLDARAAMIELVSLAWAYTLAAGPIRRAGPPALGTYLRVGAAIQAAAAAIVPLEGAATEAILLLVAAAVGIYLAVEGDEPLWLLLGGTLFALAWYWAVEAVVPPPPGAPLSDSALNFSAVPAIYAVLGVVFGRLRHTAGRRLWSAPLYALAALIAVGVVVTLAPDQAGTAGLTLLAYAVLTYAVGVLERQAVAAPVAVAAASTAGLLLLDSASVDGIYWPLVFSFAAVLVYVAAGYFDSLPAERWGTWASLHRYSGLFLAGLTAIACFGVPAYLAGKAAGDLASFVSALAFAGLIYVHGATRRVPGLDYVAALVVSVGLSWVSRYMAIDNPQAYAIPPGLCLLAIGQRLTTHPEPKDRQAWARLASGAGLILLLATSWFQSLGEGGLGSVYTILLVGEGIAAVAAAVAQRSRVYVVAGGIALAFAALRALFQVVQEIPLSVVFGGAALLILAVATLLALGRDQLRDAGVAVGSFWSDWR